VRGFLKFLVFLILLVVIGGGVAWLWAGRQPPPAVQFRQPDKFVGQTTELELMVQAGLRPEDALRAATANSAAALGIARDFGTLEKGKRADMILLGGDPLQDIRNTRKIERVWIGGREVNRS